MIHNRTQRIKNALSEQISSLISDDKEKQFYEWYISRDEPKSKYEKDYLELIMKRNNIKVIRSEYIGSTLFTINKDGIDLFGIRVDDFTDKITEYRLYNGE